jgi:PDZ domain-containing protein
VLAVLASIIGATSFRIPYYAIAPGSALPVVPLVKVTDGPYFPPKNPVYLCTVSLQRTTVLQALEGWLDPTVDVVKQETIVPKDVGNQKLTQFNLQLMDTSKQKALIVAFRKLGYEVEKGNGALIVDVGKGTPADGVLHPDDAIVAVDGEPVATHSDAIRLLGAHTPGDTVSLTVVAGNARRTVSVTLAANPTDKKRPLLGVTLRTKDPSFDFPYKVDIASERIGGPSAGLAFTLELLDVLTKGELTGGHKVAATGTMELDGSVGEVGGVAQKTVAVQEAGVKLFLVPKAEVAEARKHASKDLRIEPVQTLDDALRILAGFGGNGLALEQAPGAGA